MIWIYTHRRSWSFQSRNCIFSKVFDKQRKLYPDDIRKAVQETIRICIEMDVLNDYLAEEEAATVMYAFADQEREFSKALRKEGQAGEARGIAKGENKMAELMQKLFALGRVDDAQKAASDQIYRNQLFQELNIV